MGYVYAATIERNGDGDIARNRGRSTGIADAPKLQFAVKPRVNSDDVTLGRGRIIIIHALRSERAGGVPH